MNREDSAGLIKTEQQELDDLKKRFALLGKPSLTLRKLESCFLPNIHQYIAAQ